MVISVCIVTRGTNIVGEYSIINDDIVADIVTIISRNTIPSTRLVPIGSRYCAILNKMIHDELISFACIIDSNEDRDTCFDYIDSISSFYEREYDNPKMTSERNVFISKHIKMTMVYIR